MENNEVQNMAAASQKLEELYKIFLRHPVVTTDSRDCPSGSLFFALKGETFDGNAYATQALEKGCAYAVVDDAEVAKDGGEHMILVDDVLQTLQQLARLHRKTLRTPIIGVTGTNGKTTTKELIAAVLSKRYKILYTQGNFNNHIGVPKTLLQLTPEHELAVVEMGANHPGEIRTLAGIAEPDFGIITNVGKAHLLGFGSFEGVVRTKGELYDFIRANGGTVFINENNPHLMGISHNLHLIKYGRNGRFIDCNPFLRFEFEGREVQTKLIGAYNIDNALAAAAIGQRFGVSADDICEALSQYTPSNNRSQLKKTERNTLIIDAYNANPTSMTAALENFHQMSVSEKMCILGDMKELGEASQAEHARILQLIGRGDIGQVWFVGSEFKEALGKACLGIPHRSFDNANQVREAIEAENLSGKTILIKGSNSTRLFSLVDSL